MKPGLILLAAALLLACPRVSAAETAGAPVTIGFPDSASIGPLLRFRLPNWGYRTAPLEFTSSAGGGSQPLLKQSSARIVETFAPRWYREGERAVRHLNLRQEGRWDWSQATASGRLATQNSLSGSVSLDGGQNVYAGGALFTHMSAYLLAGYDESLSRHDSTRAMRVGRSFQASPRLGIGLGRIRDVTPVLRALRLNERVRALGREPLAAGALTHVAETLTRETAYLNTLDRPDRRFWDDLLRPLAGVGNPLSPFEVFYLRDALFEKLGSRREGHQISAGLELQREGRAGRAPVDSYGPWLQAGWSHNLSLDHQLAADFNGSHMRVAAGGIGSRVLAEYSRAAVTTTYLWDLADRFSWTNSLEGTVGYTRARTQDYQSREQTMTFDSRCFYYVEDRLTLAPQLRFAWDRYGAPHGYRRERRYWAFQCALSYDLGRGLF